MSWPTVLLFLALLQFQFSSAKHLTDKENRILRANCGRYVEGFTSLHRRTVSDEAFKSLYGKEVKQGMAPWTVSIATRKRDTDGERSDEARQHGTGTLVSPYHIVTAAHLIGLDSSQPLPNCQTGDMGEARFLFSAEDFVAFVNVTCATPDICRELGRKDRFRPLRIKSLYVRRGYVGEECADRESFNDIAVMELEEPVSFSKNVFPVCLPTSENPPQFDDAGYKLFGFGSDPASKTLTTGILKTQTSTVTECTEEYPYEGVYCTAARTRGLSCSGDSGAGVVKTAADRNVEVLVGVLSAGVECFPLYQTHQVERSNGEKLTRETDLLIDVSHHLKFFCDCCGLC